eukprot:350066-Chlamydomonas_euryale.AAC.2
MYIGGFAAAWAYYALRMRNVMKYKGADTRKSQLRVVHRFGSPAEVELLSRAMRSFDLDGAIEPAAADAGELVLRAGLLTFNNNVHLLVLLANFNLEVRSPPTLNGSVHLLVLCADSSLEERCSCSLRSLQL